MREYSEEAQKVLDGLTDDEKCNLRKDNPFRNDRDAVIIGLWKRGVKFAVISEISGLSDTSIGYIVRMQRKYQRPCFPQNKGN